MQCSCLWFLTVLLLFQSAVENAMVGLGQPAEGDAPSASPVIAPDAVPVLPTFLSDPSDGPVPVYDLTGDAGGPSPAAGDVAKVSHVPPPPLAEASSSYGLPRPTRLLQFNIEYKSRSVKLILSDTDTVGEWSRDRVFVKKRALGGVSLRLLTSQLQDIVNHEEK